MTKEEARALAHLILEAFYDQQKREDQQTPDKVPKETQHPTKKK